MYVSFYNLLILAVTSEVKFLSAILCNLVMITTVLCVIICYCHTLLFIYCIVMIYCLYFIKVYVVKGLSRINVLIIALLLIISVNNYFVNLFFIWYNSCSTLPWHLSQCH